MAKNIQAIRGMNDYLPGETALWQRIEGSLKQVLGSYGYSEIRLPIVEQTPLFKRAIGEVTDVVEKEMYTFEDRNGDSLTLRPEGTAGCVRAGIEHGLLYNQEQRLWYVGPMFRHERPQKGRYRQFHQIGAEVFGLQGPDIDAELIMLTARWWRELGISEHVSLELNSIGSLEARANYRDALVAYLEQFTDKLDEDSKRRMYTNPLRVLDSKNPDVQALLNDAPALGDYLDEESKAHFAGLCALLDDAGIRYTVNQRLVRGLDYYNRTVFEWVTTSLGSQGTVCAGGRYDGLVEQLGGRARRPENDLRRQSAGSGRPAPADRAAACSGGGWFLPGRPLPAGCRACRYSRRRLFPAPANGRSLRFSPSPSPPEHRRSGEFPGTASDRRYRAASDPAGSGAAASAGRRAGPCRRG